MSPKWRLLSLSFVFLLSILLLLSRLFYWQILAADRLTAIAEAQQLTTIEIPARRGEFITADDSFLVTNQPAYFAYLARNQADSIPVDLADQLAPIIFSSVTQSATPSSLLTEKDKHELIEQTKAVINQRLDDQRLIWIPLAHKLTQDKKDQLQALNIPNLFFEPEQKRLYPEASMSAHLVGFVGSDAQGRDTGYHGLEGYYQQELAGRPGIIRQEQDAFNQPILIGSFTEQEKRDGRTLRLYLDKSIQYLVEKHLAKGIERYGASAGSITVMDPQTGAVLAMASLPAYDPAEYYFYDKKLYLNPVIADAFEPGSIFKIFVMAAALDTKVVKPETKCDICAGPLKIDKYTINTWDNKYRPDSNMTDIIVHSDNVGMVFVGQKLGLKKFLHYFHQFGFGEKTGIDLQDEVIPAVRPDKKWSYVDLATASFGQGFLATGMQLLQAVNVIANDGELIQPRVVRQVIDDQREINIPIKVKRRVISPETAQQVTEMMVAAVSYGEAKWTKIKGYQVAGKTGTAQIAVGGKYAEEKTNASFIGFAPADKPKFAMLVTLKEPSTSPWASETAAPLWFSVAQDLFNYFNIIPRPTD
jgi:cell division protein FtsI/penicillin-binding protein 2